MEHALLIKPQDLDESNVLPLLERSDELISRCPEAFEGWYLAGLCHYRLGQKADALYSLTRAYGLVPETRVAELVRNLGGDVSRSESYALRHRLGRIRPVAMTVLVLLAGTVLLAWLVLR